MNQTNRVALSDETRLALRQRRVDNQLARKAKQAHHAKFLQTLPDSEVAARAAHRLNRARLRIKLKSLAAEAKIIRAEEARNFGATRDNLYLHRVLDVRGEARAGHLIYGLIRGMPLDRIETRSKRDEPLDKVYPPSLKQRLVQLAKKYGPTRDFTLPDVLQLK